ncbi:MAG: hypothetical protein JRJ51_22330 [Deltaproteobacteria bacterium]|nr:hypothetical protein [Deltaproteobacteria bacterium]
MGARDEITSTEKLLDLIRSPNDAGSEEPAPNPIDLTSGKNGHRRLKLVWPSKKRVTVGIDFGYKDLKLVKTGVSGKGEWQLLEYRSVPIDPQSNPGSPEYTQTLKKGLTEFCRSERSIEIWALLPSSRVEMRTIRIPRVPKKQMGNAVYWTFKKEASFDEEQDVMDFTVLGDTVEDGLPKTSVLVYTAPKEEVRQLESLFAGIGCIGFPLTGVSIYSFALQNLLKTGMLSNAEGTLGCLYLGGDWSRVDIFSAGNLTLTRGIKVGMNSLIDALVEGLNEAQMGDSMELAEEGDRSGSGTQEIGPLDIMQVREFLFDISREGTPAAATGPGIALKEEEILNMIQPALERLVRRIERSVEHHALMLEEGNIKKFYVAGEVYAHMRLDDYISEQIGIPTELIDPFGPGTPLHMDISSPETVLERASYASALGMAVSESARTPNFLYTYQDKEKRANTARLNRVVMITSLVLAALCVVTFLWLGHMEKGKSAQVAGLKKQLGKTRPLVNRNTVTQLAAKAMENQHTMKEYGKKYQAMAVIGELSRLTPPNIRLLNLEAKLFQKTDDKKEIPPRDLVLEGIASGEPLKLKGVLATYLLRLEGSPLFRQPGEPDTELISYEGKDVLRFTVPMAIFRPLGDQKTVSKDGKNS